MIIYSRVTSAPASEPVTLPEAKAWLKVDGTDEDTLITSLIAVARELCENYAGLSLITQTRTVKLDRMCGDLILPYGPVSAVTSVVYVDEDDAEQTVDQADYYVDIQSGLSRIRVNDNGWPYTNGTLNNVVVTYTTGYADAASVPEVAKTAIKMTLASLYENRQDEVIGSSSSLLRWNSRALLDTIKVYWYAET